MPPIRTIPPAKAVKTERTHEENQERSVPAMLHRKDAIDTILAHT